MTKNNEKWQKMTKNNEKWQKMTKKDPTTVFLAQSPPKKTASLLLILLLNFRMDFNIFLKNILQILKSDYLLNLPFLRLFLELLEFHQNFLLTK